MNLGDWMEIIHDCISYHDLDMRALLRESLNPEDYLGKNFETEMRNMFGGSPNFNWQSLADYAGFISALLKES